MEIPGCTGNQMLQWCQVLLSAGYGHKADLFEGDGLDLQIVHHLPLQWPRQVELLVREVGLLQHRDESRRDIIASVR